MAVLNEEQEMLRDMARDWAKNESPVAEFRKVRASGERTETLRAMVLSPGQVGIDLP